MHFISHREKSALNWTPAGYKRMPGWPVKQDIARAGAKWDDVPQLAIDRGVWRLLTA